MNLNTLLIPHSYASLEYWFFKVGYLRGTETVGKYPLLEDNTSYFIVADFDDENWKESVRTETKSWLLKI